MAWLPYIAIQRELELGALAELTDESHRIPFSIELFRCSTNTKPEVIVLWDKIRNSF